MSSLLLCHYAFVLLLILKATSFAYNSSSCGITNVKLNSRVVGGNQSQVNQWPWMTAIYVVNPANRSNTFFKCGGVLISDLYVLTASHCVTYRHTTTAKPSSKFLVHLGELDINSDQDGAHPVDFNVAKVCIHPNYVPSNMANHTLSLNDIALLKLDKKVTFSKSILPICLPTVDMINDTFEGMHSYVSGWGKTKYEGSTSSALLHVQVSVQSNKVCHTAYKILHLTIVNTHLCAGVKSGGKDACSGDSGGPLIHLLNNKWYSIGVVSNGYRCADPEYPGIYSRTTEFVDWITKTADLK